MTHVGVIERQPRRAQLLIVAGNTVLRQCRLLGSNRILCFKWLRIAKREQGAYAAQKSSPHTFPYLQRTINRNRGRVQRKCSLGRAGFSAAERRQTTATAGSHGHVSDARMSRGAAEDSFAACGSLVKNSDLAPFQGAQFARIISRWYAPKKS